MRPVRALLFVVAGGVIAVGCRSHGGRHAPGGPGVVPVPTAELPPFAGPFVVTWQATNGTTIVRPDGTDRADLDPRSVRVKGWLPGHRELLCVAPDGELFAQLPDGTGYRHLADYVSDVAGYDGTGWVIAYRGVAPFQGGQRDVIEVPIDGSGAPIELAATPDDEVLWQVVGDRAIILSRFGQSGPPSLTSVPLGGGAPVDLAPGASYVSGAFVTTGGEIVLTRTDGPAVSIHRVAPDGSSDTLLATGGYASDLVDGRVVFVTEGQYGNYSQMGTWSVPVGGGASVVLGAATNLSAEPMPLRTSIGPAITTTSRRMALTVYDFLTMTSTMSSVALDGTAPLDLGPAQILNAVFWMDGDVGILQRQGYGPITRASFDDGSETTLVSAPPGNSVYPRDFDGTRVIYARSPDGGNTLFLESVANPGGGAATALFPTSWTVQQERAREGDVIVAELSSNANSNFYLWSVHSDGTSPVQLTTYPVSTYIGLGPDGHVLWSPADPAPAYQDGDIFSVPLDGSKTIDLTPRGGVNYVVGVVPP